MQEIWKKKNGHWQEKGKKSRQRTSKANFYEVSLSR
jgi:hypothetical protein